MIPTHERLQRRILPKSGSISIERLFCCKQNRNIIVSICLSRYFLYSSSDAASHSYILHLVVTHTHTLCTYTRRAFRNLYIASEWNTTKWTVKFIRFRDGIFVHIQTAQGTHCIRTQNSELLALFPPLVRRRRQRWRL